MSSPEKGFYYPATRGQALPTASMPLDDPFFAVKEEVNLSLSNVNNLYMRWKGLTPGAANDEYKWTTSELRSQLRSIEWDLEDLDETVSIVEGNPERFKLGSHEIASRKAFIVKTRTTVRSILSQLDGSSSTSSYKVTNGGVGGWKNSNDKKKGKSNGYDKYQKLDDDIRANNQDFIERQQQEQRLIMEEQDEQLDLVGHTVGVLKNMGQDIGRELDEQNIMLEDLGDDIDHTESRLSSTLKKLDNVLEASKDKKQCCVIVVLIVVLIIMIVIYFSV